MEGVAFRGQKLSYEEEKALHAELVAERQAEIALERARAYEAVQAAIASYRWWNLSNLVNMFRLWLQVRRKRVKE